MESKKDKMPVQSRLTTKRYYGISDKPKKEKIYLRWQLQSRE